MTLRTGHDAHAMHARHESRPPAERLAAAFRASTGMWLDLRNAGRELDGAVALLTGFGLANNTPIEPGTLARLLHTTEPAIMDAIGRLERDGLVRFVARN